MGFPPGVIYLAKLLPSVLAPPLGTWVVKWLSTTYLHLDIPRWAFASIVLLSFPLFFTAKVQYILYANRRRAAAAHGAVLPPTVPSSIGGIDIIWTATRQFATRFPGEPLALIARKQGHIFSMRVLFEDSFFTTEPEHLKIMLASQFTDFEKGEDMSAIFGPFLGSGVFAADGESWKFHRAMTRPFFKRDRVSDFELFDRHSREAIAHIKQRLREGYPIDFQDMISCFALDSSGEFLFGHNAHTLGEGLPYPFYAAQTAASKSAGNDASTKFADAMNRAQLVSVNRVFYGAAWPLLLEFWSNRLTAPMGVIRTFLDPILSEAVAKKRASGSETVLDVKPTVTTEREVQEGETLVEHLLNYTEGKTPFPSVPRIDVGVNRSIPRGTIGGADRTILRDEILNISVAGRDTTACLLTFVMYMLTDHPAVLKRLCAEILETVGPERAPTPEDFREMKYLRAVLNETLRLYPPVPVNMRSTTTPVILPSTTGGKPFYIPAHSKVPYSVLVMQRRTDLWGPDAIQWDPDRFIDERLHKYLTPNPFIFLPFNAGPRICLGQQFAYHEASFFLVRLFQAFSGEIALAPDAQPPASRLVQPAPEADELGWKRRERLTVRRHLTLFIDGGLWITMKEKNQEGN